MTIKTKPGDGSKPKLRVVAKDGKRVDDARNDGRTRLNLKRLREFKERDIDWLWYPYFARGELTIVEGDPGSHKSRMIQAAIADLIDDVELPSRFSDRKRSRLLSCSTVRTRARRLCAGAFDAWA